MSINNNLLSTIGNTPLIKLKKNSPNTLFAKCEMMNPSLSIKDRMVLYMLTIAEKKGILQNGTTIVEASSGNTGCALSMMGAIKGYPIIITTPSKTSAEKIAMMRLYGATVEVSDDYIQLAKHFVDTIPNSYFFDQYNNTDNREAHYHTTGPEIWAQTEGNIDFLVAAGSTGGTISGVGRYLKEKNANIKIILADPVGSCYRSYFKTGKINADEVTSYKVEGAGKDKLCACIDFSVIDDVMTFTDAQAFDEVKNLAKTDGIFAGGSSGGALFVAKTLAKQLKNPANIVVILPDSALKYQYLLR